MSALAVETAPPLSITTALAAVRSYGALRRAEPHQRPALRVVADAGFSDLLPRWQRFGDGVHEHAEPGAYADTLAWRSRRHWLEVVVPAAVEARPEALKGATGWTIGRRTFAAYCGWLASYAHAETGRRCIVRNDTIAALMGVSERTVQRCRAAAEALGLYVLVTPGRMLTQDERWRAYWSGSHQRGYANEAALVVPAWLQDAAWRPTPVENRPGRTPAPGGNGEIVTPPKRFNPQPDNPPVGSSLGPTEGCARGQEPTPSAPRLERERRARQNRSGRVYDPHALELARTLTERLPWLHGAPPGRLETGLRRFVRCSLPWTAQDVSDAIDARNARLGNASMTADRVHNPAALLAFFLRDLDPDSDHPRDGLDTDAERAQWASRRRAENQRRAAEARRAAGPRTPAVQDAAVVAIRDELAALRARREAEHSAADQAHRAARRRAARERAAAIRAEKTARSRDK